MVIIRSQICSMPMSHSRFLYIFIFIFYTISQVPKSPANLSATSSSSCSMCNVQFVQLSFCFVSHLPPISRCLLRCPPSPPHLHYCDPPQPPACFSSLSWGHSPRVLAIPSNLRQWPPRLLMIPLPNCRLQLLPPSPWSPAPATASLGSPADDPIASRLRTYGLYFCPIASLKCQSGSSSSSTASLPLWMSMSFL